MVQITSHITLSIRVLFCSLFLLAAACGKEESGGVPADAQWRDSPTVGYAAGSAAVQLSGEAGVMWRAEIVAGEAWCSFSLSDPAATVKEGTLRSDALANLLDVYFQRNGDDAQRLATISVSFGGGAPVTLDLVQLAQSQNNLPHFGVWAEVPQQKDGTTFTYVTHYTPVTGRFVRNYSICYDTSKRGALWVAYPLHNLYLKGSGERTDAWAFDPLIAQNLQPNCVRRSYGGSYDRGHQLPSADRLASNDMNAQTFYMTNMTPQLARLNQDMWANLESKVRTYNCSDTLYVVTGAWFGAGGGVTTDGAGATVPLPTHYYKVLLRTRSGVTGKAVGELAASELMAIGFWVEQRSYGNIQPPASICMSVAEVESRTGFRFFPTLAAEASAAVKSQNNPAQWGIN